MRGLFADRVTAGRQLAERLRDLAGRPGLLVLGLPRGGVPVAFEVAAALGAPLDVLVVRKLGVPGQEELAMGAVAGGGLRVLNEDVVSMLGIPEETIDVVARMEAQELARRESLYRGNRPFPELRGATVILVDDGVATGATMLAAARAIQARGPAALIVAAPVMAREAHQHLAAVATRCIALALPEPFVGVGAWYADFAQTTDAEVLALLARGAGPMPAGPGPEGAAATLHHR